MNISGLSYLQFSLVDALIALYLLLRVHETQSWSSINPISVVRQARSTRTSALATMLGFYSCLAATVLFLVKDSIMAKQEMDDVNLCRTAVYLQQTVTPLDSEQLPDIKTGLLLWNLGTAFHLWGLGCVMYLWASAPLRRLLGRRAVITTGAGLSLLALGALGWVGVVAAHFAAFGKLGDNTANARSISRLVGSGFFLIFVGALCWVVVRVWKIVGQTRRREPYATAALVSSSQKLHTQGGYPMATLQYLLGVQMLAAMNSSAVQLVLVLLLRVLFFLIFDISFLTPDASAIRNLGANNAYTGIGTLAASLVSVLIVQILFPSRQSVLIDVLSMAAELDQPERLAFIDAQVKPGTMPMPRLTFMASRERINTEQNSRSRAPTAASLAVEKLMSSTNAPAPQEHSDNYLNEIPYIDRDTRDNSFFSQGPWTKPMTITAAHTGDRDSSTVAGAGFSSPLNTSRGLEELVRSNTGSSLITNEGRQDMLRQTVLKNEQSRNQVLSSYVPLSSSNVALSSSNMALAPSTVDNTLSSSFTTTTQRSGPSLHAEALPDNDGRPDSIVSSYIRADNAAPRRVFAEPRPSSFVSEDYQYEPIDAAKNPFDDVPSPRNPEPPLQPPTQSVYVATPSENPTVDSEPGVGPILIRKGSKASLRRKGTLERRKQRARNQETIEETPESSTESVGPAEPEQPEKKSMSRMSAFNGSPATLPALIAQTSNEEMPTHHGSATASNAFDGQRAKPRALMTMQG
ncbi:hypothetical protein IWW52_004585, partial [Coemansia sp. RSA 2704]